jgi:repressor LexA
VNPSLGTLISERRRRLRLTLQQLADRVGYAKSYLWMIEHDKRPGPPSTELLERLDTELDFGGQLIRAAQWQSVPAEVRREVTELQSKQRLAQRLAVLLHQGGGETPGRSLDEAYRSGELRRLIDALAPAERAEAGVGAGAAAADRAGGAGPGAQPVSPSLHLSASLPLSVPLINRVAAGYPTEFTDLGYPVGIADEYVRSPDIQDPDAFACRVVGDSMLPEYRQGDIVIFSPARPIRSGMDCFARIEPDHESTFKRVFFDDDGGESIRLQPLNPEYPARVYPREQVAGLFAAVSVMRSIA